MAQGLERKILEDAMQTILLVPNLVKTAILTGKLFTEFGPTEAKAIFKTLSYGRDIAEPTLQFMSKRKSIKWTANDGGVREIYKFQKQQH